MSLFGKAEKLEIEKLNEEIKKLTERLTPEQQQVDILQRQIEVAHATLSELESELTKARNKLQQAKADEAAARSRIIELEDKEMYEAVCLYQPRYDLVNSEEYKNKLSTIRDAQKSMIKNKTAATGRENWTVNGSKAEGKKMIEDMKKLMLRAFNSECEHVIERVTVLNIETSEKRIRSSFDTISKLGRIDGVSISRKYFELKIEELYLALEYQEQKRKEKEELKDARAQMREAAKLAKEIEAERKKLEKEQNHYQNALSKLNKQIEKSASEVVDSLLEKKKEIEACLERISGNFEQLDYREANQRAGYVYIISNIGAFGENVYKIGMTRRLEPMDRVDELGDASVPFDFDVHAMIFSDDAPGLENALHKAFADRKLNYINQRREFFNVTLDEIKKVVKENFDKTVEFIDVPPAEQYRQSLAYKNTTH